MGLFDDVAPGKQKVVEPRRGGLFDDIPAASSPVSSPSVAAPLGEKPSVLKTLGNFAKEVVLAPAKALATPFAAVGESGRELLRMPAKDTALKRFAFGKTEPFTRQRAGKYVERAVDAATIGVGTAGVQTGKALLKAGAKEAVKKSPKLVAKAALTDAALGGGYGASTLLQEDKITPENALTHIGGGAVAGALLPPILGKGAGLITVGTKRIAGRLGRETEKLATRLEKGVKVKASKPNEFLFAETVQAPAGIRSVVAEKTASAIRRIQKLPTELATGVIDKYYGVSKAEKAFIKAGVDSMQRTGLDVPLIEAFQRTASSAQGQAQTMLVSFIREGRKTLGEQNWALVKQQARFLDALDRAATGQSVEGGHSVSKIRSELNAFTATLSPEQRAAVNQGVKTIQKYTRSILDEALRTRRISPEGYQNIVRDHPNYIPHYVLDYLDEGMPEVVTPKKFSGRGVALKGAKGSEREIASVDEAVTDYIFKQTYLNKKQEAMNALFDLVESDPGVLGAEALKTAEQVKARFSVLKDLKEQIALGREQIKVLSGAKRQTRQLATKVSQLQNKLDKLENDVVSDLNTYLADEAKVFVSVVKTPSGGKTLRFVGNKVPDLRKTATKARALERGLGKVARVEAQKGEASGLVSALEGRVSAIGELQKNLRAQLKETASKKVKAVDIPKDMAKVTRLKDGVVEEWLVPDYLAVAMQGLDPTTSALMVGLSKALKPIELAARFTRAVTTSKNPFFTLKNLFRDVQQRQVTAPPESFWKSMLGLKDAMVDVINKDSPELSPGYQQAFNHGVFFSSVYNEERKAEDVLRKVLLKEDLVQKTVPEKLATPIRILEDWVQIAEEGVRLNVFQDAMARGLSPTQAAREAANATVDFGRSGTWVQFLNRYIPFLNARVQGLDLMVRTLDKNPEEFARRVLWTAAYPAIGLNVWNAQFSSYYSIPKEDRKLNWIIMAGQSRGRDYAGRPLVVPHYIKIPKGEVQQLASMIVDRVVDVGREKNPQGTAAFLAQSLGSLSPVGGQGNAVLWANILPEGVKQSLELSSNHSFFTGRDIVPDKVMVGGEWVNSSDVDPRFQFNEATASDVAKLLGNALNWSPAKIDHVIRTGVLNDIIRTVDILGVRLLLGQAPSAERARRPLNPWEKASQLPGLRSFIGASFYGDVEKRKRLEQEKARAESRRILERRLKRKDGLLN